MEIDRTKLHFFASGKELRTWLEKHHTTEPELFIGMYKKHTGKPSVNWKEIVDELLCFGWIDGQSKRIDEDSFAIRVTPRRPKSIWSKINRQNVARLISEKRMTPAGLAQVELAKADGRWDAAYDSPKNIKVPPDFLTELAKFPKAEAFFTTLPKSNHYLVAFRLHQTKLASNRHKKIQAFIEKLEKGLRLV